jgi:heptosyltransferase-2
MNPPAANPPPRFERILIRGVNWLGDAVMTTPALLRLREAHPSARIVVLTHHKLADLWRNHPAVDSSLSFEDENSVWQIARRVRAEQFDAALVLPNSFRSALEVFLAGIPVRAGYSAGRGWLLTKPVKQHAQAAPMHKRSVGEIQRLVAQGGGERPALAAEAHHIFHYLHLAAALGAKPDPLPPRIAVSDGELMSVRSRFGLEDDPAWPLFGLNAGAEHGPAKRWLRERFVDAAVEVHRRTNCRWVLFGGQGDREEVAALGGEIGQALHLTSRAAVAAAILNRAGQTSLRDLCGALKCCRVLLTNDTGPMHIAAAVGTPVVGIFGSTSPELTAPGLPGDPRHHLLASGVPCAPCFLRECPIDFRCMNGISVERVVEAVLRTAQQS